MSGDGETTSPGQCTYKLHAPGECAPRGFFRGARSTPLRAALESHDRLLALGTIPEGSSENARPPEEREPLLQEQERQGKCVQLGIQLALNVVDEGQPDLDEALVVVVRDLGRPVTQGLGSIGLVAIHVELARIERVRA